jgi:predicted phosphodiesterase
MRTLVLSDIHGNRFGLEQVLEDAKGDFDMMLCLGDIVGYGAHPNECCEIIRRPRTTSLSGNHDAAALELIDISWFNPVAEAAILWTRQQLTPENREWLRGLPGQREFAQAGFQAVHASLRQPWEEYILDADTAAPTLLLQTQPLCFFGHTHQPCVFAAPRDKAQFRDFSSLRGASLSGGDMVLDLEEDLKYLLNPGSCGQPRDGDPRARYALLDTDARTVEIRSVEYDVEAARSAIIEAGLPRMLGDRLRTGS